MRLIAVIFGLVAFACGAVAPTALAYEERPMRLPATGAGGAAAASSQPATWLVAAERGSSGVAAIARRYGARKLRVGTVYRVPTRRARGFADALRDADALRYAEDDVPLRRKSAFDAAPGGYARGVVVGPGLAPPAPGAKTVAVIDDIVDVSHPDLAGHTRQLNPGPVFGEHGTMVASVAAGTLNNFGVFGVFPGAGVLSYGLPPGDAIPCSAVADGIIAAARAGATVINLSLGSPGDCTTLFGAVQVAYASGSLVVAASGNEFAVGNPVIYPAAYPHVLSVASIDPNLQASGFSSENAAVDVAAPGVNVPVAIPAALDVQDGNRDGITVASGTSFAAPMVSGAAAWLSTARPDLSNGQLADVLRRSARDTGAPGYDLGTGFGIIQMGPALVEPTPRADVLEPNDGISFIDGSVFSKADPYIWRGSGKRTLSGTADQVEDPIDVYRIRLPRRSRARIRLRSTFGNPDLYIHRRTAKSVNDSRRVITRSRKRGRSTDSVTIRNNNRRYASLFYVVVRVGRDAAINTSYRLEFQRIKYRR